MSEFKSALVEWLRKNEIQCGITIDNEFGYLKKENVIIVGEVYHSDVESLLEQFFYEYGADYVGYGYFVLGLLHEIGHYFTVFSFDAEEQFMFEIRKMFVGGNSMYECACQYWETPDEFAANVWAINFINEHTAAVDELAEIMKEIVNVD